MTDRIPRRDFVFGAAAAAMLGPSLAHAARPPLEIIGQLFSYEIRGDETLLDVARHFELGYLDIVAANPDVDPWLPGHGRAVHLPTAHILPQAPRRGVVINIPELRLFHYRSAGVVDTYPLGVGREGLSTPLGRTSITRKAVGPTWRPTPRMRREDPELPAVVPPGPENPLGEFALYLGFPAYLIHGTNRPWGIGRRVSSGCIRLYPEGIERLYHNCPRGTRVRIVNQPIKVGWLGTELFVEAQFTLKQADQMEAEGRFDMELDGGIENRIRQVALEDADRVDWTLVEQVVRERTGVPTQVTRSAFSQVGYRGATPRAAEPTPRPAAMPATPQAHQRTLEADLGARAGAAPDPAHHRTAPSAPAAPRRLVPPGG